MTLPPVEFEQELWSMTAMLQDVENFPLVVVESGVRGALPDLMKGDFFAGRKVVDQISWRDFDPDTNMRLGFYFEGRIPFNVLRLASLYLRITTSGNWEILKIQVPDPRYKVYSIVKQDFEFLGARP